MKKKLTAKIQEINPSLQQFATSFAQCVVIEPESKETLLKKGSIYAVYEITGTANFDTALTDRVLRDILHNSYFQSDNISPIQSLEKAIVEAKEKIAQDFYQELRTKLNHCHTQCATIFRLCIAIKIRL